MTEYHKLIRQLAFKVVHKCPFLDIEDVYQELAISFVEARKSYCSSDLSFIGFAYRRMMWRSKDLLRNHFRRLRAENEWAHSRSKKVDAFERRYATLCSEVFETIEKNGITEKKNANNKRFQEAQQLFVLLINPENQNDVSRTKSFSIKEAAAYIGVSKSNKYRAFDEIKKAVLEVIDG